MEITGAQMRAARGLLRWSQGELAKAAGVSPETVKRLEALDGPVSTTTNTARAITSALEAAGVLLVHENGEGPGVRLRKVRPE